MPDEPNSTASESVNQESQAIWNQNAGFWDDYMGEEGNDFHRQLVLPTVERLLELRSDEHVLEIACGNGSFARRMARQGAHVVASDFSATFLERAQTRTTENSDRLEYRLIDATDEAQLLALGERRFDAAVSNMALMDMPAIDQLMSALSRILKPGGRFVFTLCHPCFNSTGCSRVVEETEQDGEIVTTYAVKVSKYLGLTPAKGLGIIGQPAAQYYFDRPLHILFNACFRAGFVLDGLEEPAFSGTVDRTHALSKANFQEMPMVLAARLRLYER